VGLRHIPVEQWQRYVDGELPPEERERCEAHLSVCDDCLELYMRCLEQVEEQLPGFADESDFAAAVMRRFDEQTLEGSAIEPAAENEWIIRRKARMPFYQHPFFHYAVAAAITLLLMSSGAFHTITQQISSIEPVPAKAEEPALDTSFSKKLLDETIVMLDSIQPKRERGSNP
jgi:anti-sigma factor RsiW